MEQIVTKEYLVSKIKDNPNKVVGRALLAIYKRQTGTERQLRKTKIRNGVGFSKPDARIGSQGAYYYMNFSSLPDWLLTIWVRPSKDGNPRICKYAKQLNQIANEKV